MIPFPDILRYVAAGGKSTAVISEGDEVFTWGYNQTGQVIWND